MGTMARSDIISDPGLSGPASAPQLAEHPVAPNGGAPFEYELLAALQEALGTGLESLRRLAFVKFADSRADGDRPGSRVHRHVHLLALLQAELLDDLGRESHREGTADLDEFAFHISI